MGGSSAAPVPEPTQEERSLQQQQADNLKQQTDILQEQYAQQRLLAPILYKQAGLNPITDSNGKITGFQVDPNQQALQDQQNRIQKAQADRVEQALAGNLPLDPAIERQLSAQEQQLRNTLASNLGPGYETSTPGQKALADFMQRKAEIMYGAAHDELTQGEQMNLAQISGGSNYMQNIMARQFMPSSQALNLGSAFGAASQGYGQALQGQQQMQALQSQVSTSNAQIASQNRNTMIAGGAGVAAAGVGAAAMIIF